MLLQGTPRRDQPLDDQLLLRTPAASAARSMRVSNDSSIVTLMRTARAGGS